MRNEILGDLEFRIALPIDSSILTPSLPRSLVDSSLGEKVEPLKKILYTFVNYLEAKKIKKRMKRSRVSFQQVIAKYYCTSRILFLHSTSSDPSEPPSLSTISFSSSHV